MQKNMEMRDLKKSGMLSVRKISTLQNSHNLQDRVWLRFIIPNIHSSNLLMPISACGEIKSLMAGLLVQRKTSQLEYALLRSCSTVIRICIAGFLK